MPAACPASALKGQKQSLRLGVTQGPTACVTLSSTGLQAG